MVAAHWVYQLSILSSMLTITQVPYNSSLIAHEKMDVYAYVEILNVTLKLLIVYLLVIGNFDKMILYAILMFTVSVIIMVVYRIYCLRRFEECKFRLFLDKDYLKPLLSFSGRKNVCYVFLMPLPLFVWNVLVLMLLALLLMTRDMHIRRTLLLPNVCFPTYSLRKTCCQCRLLALTLSARNCAMP